MARQHNSDKIFYNSLALCYLTLSHGTLSQDSIKSDSSFCNEFPLKMVRCFLIYNIFPLLLARHFTQLYLSGRRFMQCFVVIEAFNWVFVSVFHIIFLINLHSHYSLIMGNGCWRTVANMNLTLILLLTIRHLNQFQIHS